MVTEERLTREVPSAALRSIVWMAAYPKSGNTWLRIFLANLLTPGPRPVPINELPVRLHAASRLTFEEVTGIDSSDFSESEAARLRPLAYRQLAATQAPPICVKTHDRYGATPAGEPMFPADVTRVVIYLVRNPLDIAVSYAHHDRLPVDRIIERMADERFFMAGQGRLHLRQHIGGWSSHVGSWVDAPLPIEVVRYEDLHSDDLSAFSRLAERVNGPCAPARIREAAEFSSFERLREQEVRDGFNETPAGGGAFFRSGRAGGWRQSLTTAQVDRIIKDHGAVMTRFGYLTTAGTPQ